MNNWPTEMTIFCEISIYYFCQIYVFLSKDEVKYLLHDQK